VSIDAARHVVTLSFPYADERRARLVADAIDVEVGEIADDRSRAAVGRSGSRVTVTVRASDLVALRAGLNTWARLVSVAERLSENRPTTNV
jgi:KEOPS complex subunit Pcc1